MAPPLGGAVSRRLTERAIQQFVTNFAVCYSKNSVPAEILDEAANGSITPLFNDEILAEYEDVLHRKKFPFTAREVRALIEAIKSRGIHVEPGPVDVTLPDLDDVVFYAVVMEKRKDEDAYLVTGNQKHFPKEPFIVTPKEMLDIILGTNG